MKTVKLNDEQINDLLSACTFFRREYERTEKQKAPLTIKGIERCEKKLWAALRKKEL